MTLDLIVEGGLVYDGTGRPPQTADIGIADGRIVAIGSIETSDTPRLSAKGAAVAPGFIDIHSHSDFTLLVDPRAASAIHQGVTCEVIGNCGYGCFPVRDAALAGHAIYGISDAVDITWSGIEGYLERLEQARPGVNVATLVPNGQLRLSTLGMSEQPAGPQALDHMCRLLENGLEVGAWGLSTGLEYPAESAAPEEEIEILCRCVARHGGLYATHTRDRDAHAIAAVEEALRTARRAGVRLQVSHLLPRSGPEAGRRCIEAVETARADGLDVSFDMHTRLYGTTYLAAAVPPWARRGSTAEFAECLRSVAQRKRMREYQSILSAGQNWDRVILLDSKEWPQYARKSIATIAEERGQSPYDAVCDLLLAAVEAPHNLMVLIHAYTPDQQEEVFAHELCAPASDATTLAPDGPLANSTFHGAYTWAAWYYRTMVRESGRLSPEEGVRRLTGLPASMLGLRDRGRLEPAKPADIVIFDPASFSERGTTFEPNQLAAGVRHVLVNGVLTLYDGHLTGERGGKVLRFGQ